jgi:CDP-glucose 4,6-dehydratase
MENMVIMPFGNTYKGKKVLITGHTGFKGAWLTVWLLKLGAHVVGFSKDIPTEPSMFLELDLESKIQHYIGDIRDLPSIESVVRKEKPDFIFHLAAQAIVSISYSNPVETITSNVIGTMNILEILRDVDFPCIAVFITSDKCYDNVEWEWGYRESDAIGGKDIYSGSKGSAELVIKSYLNSFFMHTNNQVRIGVARAGNVIGGGDWAKDRIVVDCILAWSKGFPVDIRSPDATRPWQHVLEPLSGYLRLGQALLLSNSLHGNAFNFGPRAEQNRTVIELLRDLGSYWNFSNVKDLYRITNNIPFHEAGLLKLNCDKALFHLKWEPNLDYKETIRLVSEWYFTFYHKNENMFTLTINHISEYESLALSRKRVWITQ